MAFVLSDDLNIQKQSDLLTILVYKIPNEWNSRDAFIEELKSHELDYYSVSLLPTSVTVFKKTCHICLREYQELYNYENCILIDYYNNEKNDNFISMLKKMNSDVAVKLICQAKNNKELICPRISEHNEKKKNLECGLSNLVENWFSNEDIFKHKDILVAMDNSGWVPLTVLCAKFQDSINITEDILSKKLSQSALLIIDKTEKFVRRVDPKLPVSAEFCQILLLDIPDNIKSKKQLPALLKIDDVKIESFDYGTHSALVALGSRSEAENLVNHPLEILGMQCRLLVPNIIDDIEQQPPHDELEHNQLHKVFQINSDYVHEEVHVSRLDPSDLTYRFADEFSPPDQDTVNRIVKQGNFYFSDENVLKDLFILKKIKSNSGGWIDMNIVAKFKMMVKLSGDSLDTVVYSMCYSDQVQISLDGMNLRRRLPLPEWDSTIYIRSLFLWRMPDSCKSFENLDQVFKSEGRFAVKVSRFIRANRNIPADLKKLSDKIPVMGKEDCGVVEFSSREAMLSADEYIRRRWPSVKTFYLDSKAELPKPAVIVGKPSLRCLPPPIPIVDGTADFVGSSLQVGTRIDPRFWQAAQVFSAKKREEFKCSVTPPRATQKSAPAPKIASHKEFPPLATGAKFKEQTNDKSVFRGPKTADANVGTGKTVRKRWPKKTKAAATKVKVDPVSVEAELSNVENEVPGQ